MTRLDGARVYLRPLMREDTELIVRWRSDPFVARQLFSERPPNLQEHEAWFAKLQQGDDRIEFVIVDRGSGQPVGTAGLSRINRERKEAEYGIMVGEAKWRGQGIASEASELLLGHAFEERNLEAVTLECYADNEEALKLYPHLGFVEDQRPRGQRKKDGQCRETLTMRLTRTEWLRRAAPTRP